MLSQHDIESLRRSAAMAPLSPSHVSDLLDTCAKLSRERAAIAEVLTELPTSFASVRDSLNQLQRLINAPDTNG